MVESHVFEGDCGSGCKHGSEVDGHVEEREGRVATVGVAAVVVKVAHHHLKVAFEQAGTGGDEQQGCEENHEGGVGADGGGGRHEGVAYKHYGYTCENAFIEAPAVSEPSSQYGHEIHKSQEDRVDLARPGGVESEFCLKEEEEYGQHGVVAESFSRIGEGEDIESGGLVFKHFDE